MKDLCIRESYINKQGEEKVSWNKIGILFEAKDKQYVKLFHLPGVLVSVFEQKKKDSPTEEQSQEPQGGWLEEENAENPS